MKVTGYNSYGDIDNLEILEVAEPRPKRSEVIVLTRPSLIHISKMG